MLNKLQWKILEGISYDSDEPFEVVDGIVEDDNSHLEPSDTLEILFTLYKESYVEFYQTPISALGQDSQFGKKKINPRKSIEIIGDLWDVFNMYCKKRDYVEKQGNTGVPFGIYVSLSEKGRTEIEKDIYRCFEDE